MLNWLLGQEPATSAMDGGSLWLEAYATDPGDTGQDADPITGDGYEPVQTTAETWLPATAGEPAISANAVEVAWPAAEGLWAGGAAIRYVAAWTDAVERSEATFVARFPLLAPQAVLIGQVFAFPAGLLQFRLTAGGDVALFGYHTIRDGTGAALPQRGSVQFNGAAISDNVALDTTIITPDVPMEWRGDWDGDEAYLRGAIVRHDDALWFATDDTVGEGEGGADEPGDAAVWQLMVQGVPSP